MILGYEFGFPPISFIQFVVTLVGGMIAILLLGIYQGVIGIFGKEMKPYMVARLKSLAVFQIYSLGNSMRLEHAKQEPGGGFRLLERKKKKQSRSWGEILSFRSSAADLIGGTEKEAPIIPPSTYNVEGASTVLAFEPYPRLHEDLLSGVRALKEKRFTTISELRTAIAGKKINTNDVLFGKYTYDEFLKLYSAAAEKYSFNLTVDDVLKFLEKHSSQRFSESLSTRITNSEVKKKRDSFAKKYGIYIVLIWVVGLLLILAYKVIFK